MLRNLGVLLLIGLVVYCVIDIVRSEAHERLGVHQALWILLVVLFPLLGSVVWLAVSITRRGQAQPRPAGWGATTSRGPSAPDDDDEFLWRLDQERRENPPKDDPKP
ncbi:PLDc_N domain-containing protein [Cellulomonas sp. JH27-2]|uniref:PLD nuclease N-terminal domain-containing protein n=1 Tax=Cellulomonas sp. JH27-2 TaxID=2774139 RepID=UPI00177C4454|nr:PLD nuclease N-terminal domain-containing protein [Cellulomonas sp. JH27-2]MBD8057464.1 PLDc_N domain-containing protein [Cellulomonas sp. JH27-2]